MDAALLLISLLALLAGAVAWLADRVAPPRWTEHALGFRWHRDHEDRP
jgi:hypothetical protein